ncbi:hypothetical protein ACIA98_31370 [Streptomyces sp. NPDC051366]|uniref:hypothetical protein n=1 Tax=Streptomyces sp. NPDC051366 TaxID=3365652 RepID=UPI003791F55D
MRCPADPSRSVRPAVSRLPGGTSALPGTPEAIRHGPAVTAETRKAIGKEEGDPVTVCLLGERINA